MTINAYAVTAAHAGLDDRVAAPDHLAIPSHLATADLVQPEPVLRDHEVYCSDAELWAPVDDLFCQFCGSRDHDLR